MQQRTALPDDRIHQPIHFAKGDPVLRIRISRGECRAVFIDAQDCGMEGIVAKALLEL